MRTWLFFIALPFTLTLLLGCGSSSAKAPATQTQSGGPSSPGGTGADPFSGWNLQVPPSPGQNPTFTYIQQNILKPRCDTCHSDSTRMAGLTVDSYQGVMQSGFVTASDPLHSWLYAYVSRGFMPPQGPLLTPDEVSDIYTWILNGAQNN